MIGTSATVRLGERVLGIPATPFRLDRPIEPAGAAPWEDESRGIAASLDRTRWGAPIRDALRDARRILIVVSDGTRSTAADRYLPALIERLAGGARHREIALAIGGGLHRPPSDAEIERIVGSGVARAFSVLRHDPDVTGALAAIGRTSAGTRVVVNRALLEHDAVVLTGAIGFHYYAGFSGGRKAIVPGMAGRETIVGNHLRAVRRDGSRHPAAAAGRLSGNPVHRDMAEAAALVGPAYLVNAVLAPGGGIEALFAGHWRRAHEAGCRHLRRTRRLTLEPRDLVVASAGGHPSDVNLVQAHKAFEAGFAALRPRGTFVLVASCREGSGSADFDRGLGFPTEGDLTRDLLKDYRVYGQTALAWRRKAASCRLILVSDLPDDTVRRAGAVPAGDLDDAFRIARRDLPAGTPGWILSHAPRFLIEAAPRPAARAGRART